MTVKYQTVGAWLEEDKEKESEKEEPVVEDAEAPQSLGGMYA